MPAWAMQLVQRQPVTHSETLSQKDKEEKKEEDQSLLLSTYVKWLTTAWELHLKGVQ